MEALARLVVSFCDLLEAEARLLRQRAVEAASGAVLVLLAGFCAALGLALLGRWLYVALEKVWGAVGASGVLGAGFLALGGGLWWIAGRRARS